MSFIHRQYELQATRARGPRRRRPARPAPRAARGRPGQRHQPGGRPGHQLRADADPRRPGGLRHRRHRAGRAAPRRAGSASCPDVPLVIVESPYRAVVSPFIAYLDILDQAWPPDKEAPITIVVLPEYVARHWWDRLLYNQTAKRLKAELVGREHTVIADVPYPARPLTLGPRPAHDWRPVDRRPAAPPGPQTGGPARPRRAPARPVLPLHGPGPAGRQAGAPASPLTADRPRLRARRAPSSSGGRSRTRRRSASGCRKKKALAIFSSDAISSSAYATEEILRVLVARRRRRAAPVDPGRDRDRDPAGRRLDLVPPGLPRLPERRRRVRRRPDEPRARSSG